MDAMEGKCTVSKPVCCINVANGLLWLIESLASIHRMMSWLAAFSSLMKTARSSRHCWRGFGVVVVLLMAAMKAAWRRYEVSGPADVIVVSGTR